LSEGRSHALQELTPMSAQHRSRPDPRAPEQCGDWLRVPAVVNANGEKVVTLYDDQGRATTRLMAEIVLETFVGPRPRNHVVGFKDGNHLNCELSNLEWVAASATRNEGARAKAIATRQRADAIRHTLAGREHSDSAELVAEDRLR
jgi:HNH endonuclease